MTRSSRIFAFPRELLREQRYRKRFLREDARQDIATLLVICAGYVLSIPNDFTAIDDNHVGLRYISLAARALLVVITGITVVAYRRVRWPWQWNRVFNLAIAGLAILPSTIHLTKVHNGQPMAQLIASGALVCVLYFALRGPVWPRAIAGFFVIVGTTMVVVLSRGSISSIIARNSIIALLALSAVGVISARSFEENRRTRFDAERRERQARQALAIEKERAEAMSHARAAFLAAMSHEFRTPMNAVIGLSDLLLEESLADKHRRHVRTINESARALLGMLNEILDFAKIDAQKISLSNAPFDIRDLATSIVDMLRLQASKRSVEISLEISPDVPKELVGDDARIRQVLVNILSNAVKFTERGTVKLRIDARLLEGRKHEIAFSVRDSGIGMKPEVLTRLFRPFEQADATVTRRYGGTGLGLSISKRIVNAMGGDIHVESEIGRGSIFSFAIPLETVEPHAEIATALPHDAHSELAILVVDDNAINRDVARAKLGQIGCRIDLATDGSSAIEAVSKTAYDVVFMDLRMPDMTGIEATKIIRDKLAGKPMPHIVAMTASVFEEDREACRNAGMRDFAGKPIDLVQIDALLRRIAEERGIDRNSLNPNPPLVKETIAALKELENLGEPGVFANLVDLFVKDLETRFPQMVEAAKRDDLKTLENQAHTIKSSSASLGAAQMSELCAQLEVAAREGRISDARTLFGKLTTERQIVERALLREVEIAAK